MLFNRNSWCAVIMGLTPREVTALQTRWKSVIFSTPPCAHPSPPYPWASCTNEEKLGQKEHALVPRGTGQVWSWPWTGIQTTVFHGSCQKHPCRCKYTAHLSQLISPDVIPQAARTEDSFTVTSLQHFAACGELCLAPPVTKGPETCCLKPPELLNYHLSLGTASRLQQHGQHLKFTLYFLWYWKHWKAEPNQLKLHVWSEPLYTSTHCWRNTNLLSHCFETRGSVQFIFMFLFTLIQSWRWQHLSPKKLSLPLGIKPSIF